MRKVSMTEPATLFKGPDMEKFSIHRDTIRFPRLDEALRYSVEKLTGEEKYGAYIRVGNDEEIRFPEIVDLYESLKSEH